MKITIYYKNEKGKPYESLTSNSETVFCTKDAEFLMLPKGRSKIITMQYSNGKEVKYEMLIPVGHKRSQTFRTFDFATLASVHKENAKSYEYLFIFKEYYYEDDKRIATVVARFMSFDEWCNFHEETGL